MDEFIKEADKHHHHKQNVADLEVAQVIHILDLYTELRLNRKSMLSFMNFNFCFYVRGKILIYTLFTLHL